MYCLNTLVKLIKGLEFREIIKKKIKDEKMKACRSFYYANGTDKGEDTDHCSVSSE